MHVFPQKDIVVQEIIPENSTANILKDFWINCNLKYNTAHGLVMNAARPTYLE